MVEHHAFVFTCDRRPVGRPARTLKEFVTSMAQMPLSSIEGHTRNGDFSRWIADVFGDQPLAQDLRSVERRYRRGQLTSLRESIISPIRKRYELIGAESAIGVSIMPETHVANDFRRHLQTTAAHG